MTLQGLHMTVGKFSRSLFKVDFSKKSSMKNQISIKFWSIAKVTWLSEKISLVKLKNLNTKVTQLFTK